MKQSLFKFKVKKDVLEDGQVVRYYTFIIKEPVAAVPSADCSFRIENGKIEDLDVLIRDDDRFDVTSLRVSVVK